MFMTLFRKECAQTVKSLIYWLYVACLVLFFNSQLGNMHILAPPQEGQENYLDYGYKTDISEQEIMKTGAGSLVWSYYYDNYVTYPVGYAKSVSLDEEEKEEIGDIIYSLTGMKPEEIEADIASFFETHDIQTTQYEVRLKKSLTYEEFLQHMDSVAEILGPGSGYTEEMLRANVRIPVDYKGAVENYRDLTEKEGLTGGYTRLFCDYMGVILGILPVFVTATRVLRDKRSRMQELIYVRRASSGTVMGSRYLALICMHMLPAVVLSVIPTINCIRAGIAGADLDYLAWMKYDLGWLLPMVMAVISVGILCTELTETALAVLIQTAWWFISLMTGGTSMYGGNYGWNLIPRHNTELNYAGFAEGFRQLAVNRIIYAVLALAFLALTIFIYERKRKGHLRRDGKIFRNHKSAVKA
ncbi:MAG TPA: ABC transporter permease [Candidatus Mediterraneibacter tabaqchaliae]|uniref:ABC transporter permease n=1 Tax=Candidatus Mediterraneibacter tabaqchaliae TaxID=2838689 RepID=A0A9D2R2R5_9FIRM|nr:ABC transporter permease [Candidatus Mediterraneibacter tabaqchaliae]